MAPEFVVLAQTDLGQGIKSVVELLQLISVILAVACLIVSGFLVARGEVQGAINGAIAAGILALAASIVKFIFEKVVGSGFDNPL